MFITGKSISNDPEFSLLALLIFELDSNTASSSIIGSVVNMFNHKTQLSYFIYFQLMFGL